MGNCICTNINKLKLSNSSINEFSLNGKNMWGKVVYVYDGDTIHIVFNINNQLVKFNCRLSGIDCPEIVPKNIPDEKLRKQEIESAIKSRNYLINQVTNIPIEKELMNKNEVKTLCSMSTKLIWVNPYNFDKYGRLLVQIYNDPHSIKSINQDMIDKKYAYEYDGGTKKQFNKTNFNYINKYN